MKKYFFWFLFIYFLLFTWKARTRGYNSQGRDLTAIAINVWYLGCNTIPFHPHDCWDVYEHCFKFLFNWIFTVSI